ncbi:glutamine-fructose-6-phosphate transaminase (isomerizing) [Pseudoloma neurophilia]|uniref:glutamine--fructose-6-phosphate transaminase (isomerizing) n=1 Tax=Pseudoloma neurophilia TaxID=146866 RepID=A0A0R0M345_9MICR|nr:glutamine-fructose-6-phosphate transaminase (isomerizing) [Pseudoloma neurophilia]
MCGIYGYSHKNITKSSKDIANILTTALQRMEYRGYDSAGVCMVCDENCLIVREKGRVEEVKNEVERVLTQSDDNSQFLKNNELSTSVAIAHTRWATHGPPCAKNSHPITSDKSNQFIVVHNGIITNHHQIRCFLKTQDISFETDTDTECASKLAYYIYKQNPTLAFSQIVRLVAICCDGAFAFVFVSTIFKNEMVAVRRHSPLILGIKMESDIGKNITISESNGLESVSGDVQDRLDSLVKQLKPEQSEPSIKSAEFFLASDTAAIVEHTRDVIFLKDNDLVLIKGDQLTYETVLSHDDIPSDPIREITHLDTKIESIMKGNFEHFMLKEIYEQSETVSNTMRGRLLEIGRIDEDVATIPTNISLPNDSIISEPVNNTMIEQGQPLEGLAGGFESSISNISANTSFNSALKKRIGMVTNNNMKKYQICLPELTPLLPILSHARRMLFISCGTSYHSSHAVQSLFEELTQLPVYLEIASDFIDRQPPVSSNDICFFISQSGETADSLQALNYCKNSGAYTVGLTNTQGSSISRLTDINLNIGCGPEIGVASTKAFTSQYLLLVMIALYISEHTSQSKTQSEKKRGRGRPKQIKSEISEDEKSRILAVENRRQQIMRELANIPEKISACLSLSDKIAEYAQSLVDSQNILLLGRGYQYSLCLEAALKIKELTYIHAEGIVMGELKHGPLALIDKDQKIIILAIQDKILEKTLNSISEVVTRNGLPFILCSNSLTTQLREHFPDCQLLPVPDTVDCLSGLLTVIPMQLLAYHLALAKGNDVDKPRNLAKSVTVE